MSADPADPADPSVPSPASTDPRPAAAPAATPGLRGPRVVRVPQGPLAALLVLASFYTLYLARGFFLPLILAVLLALLLAPLVRGLKRLKIPEFLGAAIVLSTLLGGLGFGAWRLAAPASDWIEKAPQNLRKVERKLRDLKRPVQNLGKATEQVEKLASVGGSTARPTRAPQTPLSERLVARAGRVATSAAITVILAFFVLASGDLFLRKLIRVLPRADLRRRASEIAREVQSEISTYLTTVTFINLGLGLGTGLALAALEVPNPMLWGAMVAVANYVPYLGAGICYVVIALVGLTTFDTLGRSLLPVGAFLVLNVIEAYFVSPWILGRRLTLNPVVVFVSLTFWTWLWGIPGAILAVPITVVLKIVCDHSERLAALGEFLGE